MFNRFLLMLAVVVVLCCSCLAQSSQRTIAITFDDLPKATAGEDPPSDIRATTERLLQILRAHRAPAIGFVNESQLYVPGQIDARVDTLRLWLDAGMELGNHTFSHLDLNTARLQDYEDDVIKGEVVWRRLMDERNTNSVSMAPPVHYFRHPYIHTGDSKDKKDALDAFLHSRGYTVAPFTVGTFDYGFNAIYRKALRSRDTELAHRIRSSYLDYSESMFGYVEQKSRDLLGREVPQVLLIHANDINADSLDEILTRLEQRGYRFITLGTAMSDPIYATKDDYVGKVGPSWLHRWALALGKPVAYAEEPDPPKWVLDRYNSK